LAASRNVSINPGLYFIYLTFKWAHKTRVQNEDKAPKGNRFLGSYSSYGHSETIGKSSIQETQAFFGCDMNNFCVENR
jgi:hypothetical protein